ncbi:uncharacterized protein knl1 isoform 2-T2 [Spinachia spinachia]
MEPLDPANNEEERRFSRRRISSILKAPRKSVRCPETPEQEYVVECAKPVEKRNSRRVSFAPANDVLLFSKDVKNGSPVRSPLQELMTSTSAAAQNRVHVAVTEDGIQPIMGMETLLNAPLHGSQQRDTANFDTGYDLGEKTVVFSTDDAFLDMTQSHTINIDAGLVADISFPNYDSLPARGRRRGTLTASDGTTDFPARNMDAGAQKGNISSAPILDPEFQKFLASFSKPSEASVYPVIPPMTPAASSGRTKRSMAQGNTQTADVDKENQALTSVSFVMEESHRTARKSGGLAHGRVIRPEDDVSTGLNRAQAGGTLGFAEDEDAFQCLFPTQEMYSQLENRAPHTEEETHQQQIVEPPASHNPEGMTSLRNRPLHDWSQGHMVDFPPACGEKTVRFSASDAAMDVTRCHTGHIATDFESQSHQNVGFLPAGREQTVRFSAADAAMDMTQCLTVQFDHVSASDSPPRRHSDILPSHENVKDPLLAGGVHLGRRSTTANAVDAGVRKSVCESSGSWADPAVTRSIAPAPPSPIKTHHSHSPDAPAAPLVSAAVENRVNKTTMDDDVSMEVTKSHSGCILGETDEPRPRPSPPREASSQVLGAANPAGEGIAKPRDSLQWTEGDSMREPRHPTGPLSQKAEDLLPAADSDVAAAPSQKSRRMSLADLRSKVQFDAEDECREQPRRFPADDARPRGSRSPAHIAPDFHLLSQPKVDFPPACGEKTVRFSASDAAMDVTRCHTGHIATDFESQSHQNVGFLPAGREQTVRFSAADAAMDMTQCLTVQFDHVSASDSPPRRHSDILPSHENVKDPLLAGGVHLGRRSTTANAVDAGVRKSVCESSGSWADPAVTRSIAPAPPSPIKTHHSHSPDAPAAPLVSAAVENRVNKTTMDDDVSMEVTKSHSGCILGETDEPRPRPSPPREASSQVLGAANPAGEGIAKPRDSLQWTEGDSMREPRHPTGPLSQKAEDLLPAADSDVAAAPSQKPRRMSLADLRSKVQFDAEDECREQPRRFPADDARPRGSRSPAHIAPDFHLLSQPKVDFPPACGEKTVRFSASDAAMDVTRCHTGHIATDFESQSHQNVGFLPAGREQTVRFSAADAAMDMTQCLTVQFDHVSASDSPPRRHSDILPSHENVKDPLLAGGVHLGRRSTTANAVDAGVRKSVCESSGSWADPAVTRSIAPAPPSPIKTHHSHSPDAPLVSAAVENRVNKTTMDDDVSMEVTKSHSGCILGETDEPRPRPSPPREPSSQVLGAANPAGEGIAKPRDSLQWTEGDSMREPRHPTGPLSQKAEDLLPAADSDVAAAPSQKSRRMSLADLRSKVRRLSHIIHTAPVDSVADGDTAPLPEHDKKTKDDPERPSAADLQIEMGWENEGESTQAPTLTEGEPPFISTTPFNLKTKQLMSRLSVGSFKAKLPQRGQPEDPKKQSFVGEAPRTLAVDVTDELGNSDIYDEELVTYGDMWETPDTSPQGDTEKGSASHGFLVDELLGDDVFQLDFSGSVPGKKRPFPVDETDEEEEEEDEKRTKTSTEATGNAETSPVVQCDTDTPSMTGQSTDYSVGSTRCEATFESTLKQSMFESQLEDCTKDVQRKLNDGTITVLEFFRLFNIDFIVNNPRRSNFPGRPSSDTDRTLMDSLRGRHIFRPQQMVYEADVVSLTEKVEGLKDRMWDLEKPLKIVNRALWEEMRNSSEKELTFFGAKLKDRNNFFRRMSKVQSHEMKEVLYSKLLQASQEEQQRTRGTLEEADEMLKSLDDCIQGLETELTAIEENGFENKPSLKSLQEEMQKVTEALADKDRQISELELQKTQSSKELKRLKAETNKLESHVNVLHMVNEWRLAGKTDNGATYAFLHETLLLELLYEESSGNDARNQSERKISHLRLKLRLDDEKSEGHARLVHKLLAEFVEGEGDWAQTYPTSRHVPKLLHDVGLVVSRCRLLGEELRLLKLWGGMRLDILHISCLDTRVHIVFSCLKKCSKFKVIFAVSLVNNLYVLQVQSFQNVIGNTTIQQIEEIVSSFSPAEKLLTKIVKRIHDDLLC